MANIVDSGNRREFDSGAVRDIQEGKGRCDLLPLDVIGDLLHNKFFNYMYDFNNELNVDLYTRDIYEALELLYPDPESFVDIYTMVLEVAKHFEDGAKKYGERNWEKGIPIHCYVDSGVRHYLKWLRGDDDERHDRACAWNLLCALWTLKHHPELDDRPCSSK